MACCRVALALPCSMALSTAAGAIDPKTACQAEGVITLLAGVAPDKLDFFGTPKGQGSFACEAYFSFKIYAEVWTRINDLAATLKTTEAMCTINGLVTLPKLDALQMTYDMTTAGQFTVTSISNGLPVDARKLSGKLKAGLARLKSLRDADDDTIYQQFARRNCPEADYPDEME